MTSDLLLRAIADLIHQRPSLETLAVQIADYVESESVYFDREKFLLDCYVEEK
jgi:hypothetical protein